jgi:hypothetical protein
VEFVDVRKIIESPKSGKPRENIRALVIKPLHSDELTPLLEEWFRDPEAFFRPWSLPDEGDLRSDEARSSSSNVGADYAGDLCARKDALWKRVRQIRETCKRKAEYSIRWIVHALFFRDIVLLQSPRRKVGAVLPRAGTLEPLVEKAWRGLTGEKSSPEVTKELVGYVKDGQQYHVIGKAAGEGAWFILSKDILQGG